jgi:flagellar operon protein
MNRISIHSLPFQPNIPASKTKSQMETTSTFAQYLDAIQSSEPIKLSKHASDRMDMRDIQISSEEWETITQKVHEAKQKGVKQPLVLLDQAALIVSAKNNTVITAMDRIEAKEQLFTNIDGTIVL